jgi:hypothetical protein
MKRTNIYLADEQLELLRALGQQREEPVAVLVREAVDSWLEAQGARRIPADERQQRFEALLRRRDRIWSELGVSEEEVEREVDEAISEVRKARAARRP